MKLVTLKSLHGGGGGGSVMGNSTQQLHVRHIYSGPTLLKSVKVTDLSA